MALKSINDKAGPCGLALRGFVQKHAALANALTAGSALLPTFLSAFTLSGGVVPDVPAARNAVQALIDNATVPSDAEIDAATGGLLDAGDKLHVKQAIRCEAALRYVLGYLSARLPSNDV